MKSVGSRELKNRLGRYLRRVASGEELLITDRGKPVARLTSVRRAQGEPQEPGELLRRLAAEGQIRLATRPFRKRKPPINRGKSLSQILLEDRG
jgi:prevent-host-death family protein